MGRLTLSFIDYSGEKSGVSFPIPDLGAGNVESYTVGGLSTAYNALNDAVVALTLMSPTGHTATAQTGAVEPVAPTSPFAQRESGLLFLMSDPNGHKTRLILPGPDLAIVASPNTDEVDLAVTEVAALVTAIETYCTDPITGLALTVYGARIVGRNN